MVKTIGAIRRGTKGFQSMITTVTGPDKYGSMYIYMQPGRRGFKKKRKAEDCHGGYRHTESIILDFNADGSLWGIELLGILDRKPRPRVFNGEILNIQVSNTCVCGHGMHRHPVTAPAKGKCTSFKCKCGKFDFGNFDAPKKKARNG